MLARFSIFGFAGQELDGFGGERAFELLVAGHDECNEAIAAHFTLYDVLTRKAPHWRVWRTESERCTGFQVIHVPDRVRIKIITRAAGAPQSDSEACR